MLTETITDNNDGEKIIYFVVYMLTSEFEYVFWFKLSRNT